jgi:hypothetical protein
MSLPSNTSETSESGINLLGIDREIIPKNSMAIKN